MGDGWSRRRAELREARLDVLELQASAFVALSPEVVSRPLVYVLKQKWPPELVESKEPLAPPYRLGSQALDDEALAGLSDIRHARSAFEHLLDGHRFGRLCDALAGLADTEVADETELTMLGAHLRHTADVARPR